MLTSSREQYIGFVYKKAISEFRAVHGKRDNIDLMGEASPHMGDFLLEYEVENVSFGMVFQVEGRKLNRNFRVLTFISSTISKYIPAIILSSV